MEQLSRDLVLIDTILPNGTAIKVAALSAGTAHDVSFARALRLDTFEDAISGIAEMAKNAVQSLAPEDVEIEFGLGLTVEAGRLVSLLTSVGTAASVAVRLRWHRPAGGHDTIKHTASDAGS
jgi:hypothetical protein